MAKFTYHERFTNVKKYDDFSNSYTGIKIASKLNQKNGEDYKLLDVTDLDWQGAWLKVAGAYINDTYELLEAIDNIADLAELEWVKNKINELDENVTNIINVLPSYVTRDEFDLIISQQQKALIPGAYIAIDTDTNIIFTYDLLSIEDAEKIYATKVELGELGEYIDENFYNKIQSDYLINSTAYSYIHRYVIKGADKRYDDLEKISNWILSQSKFVPIDYSDIDPDGNEKYFIYDETTGEYIEVDKEYIETHPDIQYYIEEQIIDDLTKLNVRVNRLDDVVGYVIYDEHYNSYTYTGLISDVKGLIDETIFIEDRLDTTERNTLIALNRANEAYNTSIVSYDMAYFAYEMSLLSDAYAYAAYVMAYDSQIKIGNEYVEGYYRPINEEELERLKENQFSVDVYSKENPEDEYYKHETYFDLDKYENGELYYYVYVEPIESTGFYKTLEDYDVAIKEAQYTADNALFGLNTKTLGTSYAYIDLDPDNNDGTNKRTIILNVDEANITIDDGKILKDGFITTYSLYNSLAYTSSIYQVFGLYDDINGLIKIDENDILYIYNKDGIIEHIGKSVLTNESLIIYEYDKETNTITNNIIYKKDL